MNKRNILNVGLALALASLVAVVVYDPGKEAPKKAVLLTQLTPTDIQKIVIEQTNQHSIVLSKTKNQWQMSEPYNNQANTLRINKLLALTSAKSHAQYSASETSLKQLKLFTPELIVTLDDKKLSFGTTESLNGFRYIQINNIVHLITDRYSHLIRGQATNLLNPALLPNNTKINRLVLPELTIQTNETGWQTIPDNKSDSADQLQQLLDEWRFARALRLSKISSNTNRKATDSKGAVIEVHIDKNQLLHFDLIRRDDEIILQRADTGLSYHFATEAGERLLKLPPGISNSTNNN